MVSQRTRHVASAVAALLVFVVLAGVTYQSVATALERRRFPYPGRLVDVGGHQLHLHCVGEGSPTVLLEAPAAGISVAWEWVQDAVRKTTRVCSYDRAALGWSEAGDGRYRGAAVPEQLHALLEAAGERGPFVIAGHELGAAFARMYASRHRENTAALVLIDDPSAVEPRRPSRLVKTWPWLARIGLLRVTGALSRHTAGLPEASRGAARAFLNRPDHLTRGAMEVGSTRDIASLASTEALDPSLPVRRVTTGEENPPALLDSPDRAREVARAIEDVVKRIRR